MKRTIVGLALGVALVTGTVHAESYNMTLTGASPGGLWSRIGGGVDAALAAAYPGSTVTYQTSSGGLANIPMVSGGKVPLGIAMDAEVLTAKKGKEPYKSPITNVRALFRAYTPGSRFQAMHVIANKDFADKYGVYSLEDMKAKKPPVRIAVNRRGNMDGAVGLAILEESGITPEMIESWGGQVVYAASKEMVSLLLDRRIDVIDLGVAYNHPRIREIAQGITPVLMSLPQDVAQRVADNMGGEVCMYKKGEYAFSDKDVTSVCLGAIVIVSDSMDDATAYALAKGMVGQIDKFKAAHRLLEKATSTATMTQASVVPFHPGAAKYYREAGLLK